MVDQSDEELAPRPPTLEDLLRICTALNQAKVRYLVLGGMAMIEHGLVRATKDIDLLLDNSDANINAARQALACLHDKASMEVRPSDVREYTVVRVNDEITVDLMGAACGIDYAAAEPMIVWREIRGVRIPFASLELLWKTKQTYRDKDALDRVFLREIMDIPPATEDETG